MTSNFQNSPVPLLTSPASIIVVVVFVPNQTISLASARLAIFLHVVSKTLVAVRALRARKVVEPGANRFSVDADKVQA
jgi:hypothetical protein